MSSSSGSLVQSMRPDSTQAVVFMILKLENAPQTRRTLVCLQQTTAGQVGRHAQKSACVTDTRQHQAGVCGELTQIYERERPPARTQPGHSQWARLRASAESTDDTGDPDTAAAPGSRLVRPTGKDVRTVAGCEGKGPGDESSAFLGVLVADKSKM